MALMREGHTFERCMCSPGRPEGIDVTCSCSGHHVEVVGGNADDALDEALLPYGHAIIERGSCRVCGATLERRRRIDGWGPWHSASGDASGDL